MRYLNAGMTESLEKNKMILIAGPRQVGKTTLVNGYLENLQVAHNYFNWDITKDRQKIIHKPDSFWLDSSTGIGENIIALDEIHKYSRWKNLLKGLYDGNRQKLKIIVTGSGRLNIYQRGGDSLFGRYHLYELLPFTVNEILNAGKQPMITPDKVIQTILNNIPDYSAAEQALVRLEAFNGFPEPFFSAARRVLNRWRIAHRQLLVREDVRDLTRIVDLGLFENLVMLLPERVGSTLSINAICGDLGVAFNTAKLWINVLDRLYYLFQIKPYAEKLARALRKEAKAYLYDWSEIESPGVRFENIIALHLLKACKAWTDYGYGEYQLWYLRDKEKREVDFLLTQDNQPWIMVEAKLSDKDISPHLGYFQRKLNVPHAFQVVHNIASDHLAAIAPNMYRISSTRLLANLV